MDLLIGCKATYKNQGVKAVKGVIVKVDCQEKGDWIWLVSKTGALHCGKRSNVKIDKADAGLIYEFNENRIRRLGLLKKEDVMTREDLIDLED
jgi:hypothetical protein